MGNVNKDYFKKRKSSMFQEAASFIPHYRELSEFVKPRRGQYLVTDRNKGDKRHKAIINSAASRAHRICTSGMLAGTMSPSRPWFGLSPWDRGRESDQAAREWLYVVEEILRNIFNAGNLYAQAPHMLGELVLFGTGLMMHVNDFEDVARFYTQTVGSYAIGQDDRGEVDTMAREFEWTAGQIVNKFGIENVSDFVKNAVDVGNYDAWAPVHHIIEKNTEWKMNSPWAADKQFRDVYYEPGAEDDKYLQLSGHEEFPAYGPRWDLTGSDIYGTDCPGMSTLGDVKGLQVTEKRKAQAVDFMVLPAMTGPPSVRNSPVNQLPGGLTIFDGNGGQKLESLYNVNLPINEVRADINEISRRIDEGFYVDLFLAISSMEGIQPRNELDLLSRNEERLLQLGPVLERIHGEFLDKLINRTFNQAVRAGALPPAPESLQGQPLRVRYVSSLAMAQRAVATQSIDRYAQFAAGLRSQGWEEAKHKFDAVQAMDEYAKAIGVPPTIVPGNAVVQAAMEQEAAAQQAQQQAAMAGEMAKAAGAIGGVKTGEGQENALTDVMNG